jgi:uncharacterized membrane protein (DUF106 family)
MINAMQQRHIIGKAFSKAFNSEKMKRLRNKADSLKFYTEAAHRNEDEKDKCLRCISRESDEMVKIIDEMVAEWQN